MQILVFGDSIAQGAFDTEKNGWASRLMIAGWESLLSSKGKAGFEVFNLSVSGDTTQDLLERVESDLRTRGTNKEEMTAILSIGTNDAAKMRGVFQVSLEQYKQNIDTISQILETHCAHIFVTGFPSVYEGKSNPWCHDQNASWRNTDFVEYEQYQIELAHKKGWTFIPLSDLLDTTSGRHLPDGIHPNAEGHELIFQRVKQVLEEENII